jgi:hypothetical protein
MKMFLLSFGLGCALSLSLFASETINLKLKPKNSMDLPISGKWIFKFIIPEGSQEKFGKNAQFELNLRDGRIEGNLFGCDLPAVGGIVSSKKGGEIFFITEIGCAVGWKGILNKEGTEITSGVPYDFQDHTELIGGTELVGRFNVKSFTAKLVEDQS